MASEHVLNFEELLQPIPGDEKFGAAVPFTIKQQLEDARKEDNPEDYDPGDPQRPEEAKKADWPGIVRSAHDVLVNSSKDLLTAARMTEALTKLHRFAGLRDGLTLMSRMLEQCWDFVYPPLTEPDDMEIRAAAFNWLDDPDRGARFPGTVQMVPLVFGELGYSYVDWRMATEKKPGAPNADDITKAIDATSAQECKDVFEDIQACRDTLVKLGAKTNELMGQVAPAFTFLRPAIDNCLMFMQQIVKRKGPLPGDAPAESAAETGEAAEEGAAAGGATKASRRNTREDLYRTLTEVAAQLQTIEPHSPIPYLIQKAVSLGALPFPDLMKALIRDANVLHQMSRELGIPGDAAAEEE